jgi:hypothetical protein
MSRTLTVISAIFLVCLGLAILGGLVWANTIFMHSQPVEKDFLIPWLGARTFIQYGESPYGDPATQRAQINYYGHLAAEGQDPLVLWLPPPVELLYFPIALVEDYTLARAIWMTGLEVALVAFALLSLRVTGWKPGRVFLPVILLFPLMWVYGAFSVAGGSAMGFAALALAGFLLALRSGQDELAGGLLLLLITSPRLFGVVAFFLFWWIFSQRRWRVLWGFLMAAIILTGLAFLFFQDWFLPFLRGLLSHISNDPGLSSTGIFATWSPVVGRRFGWVLTIILAFVLFFEWGTAVTKDFRALLWTVCLTLAVTPLLGIPMDVKDFPYLFIPLVLFLYTFSERWPRLKRWYVAEVLLLIILGAVWFLVFGLLKANALTTLRETMILLPPFILSLGLVWMRWWFFMRIPIGLDNPR